MSERPERNKQAEMIVNALRQKHSRTNFHSSKRIKKMKRRQGRQEPSSPALSDSSFLLMRTPSGQQKKVAFRIIQDPPEIPKVNFNLVLNNALRKFLDSRLVTENFYSVVQNDRENNSILLRNTENREDYFELQKGSSPSSVSGETSMGVDQEVVQDLKNKYRIEYLF